MSEDKRSTAMVPAPLAFSEVQTMAKYLQGSSLLPAALRGKEADVAMTIATGHELGLAPMTALRAVHIVQGRPVLAADAMVAIVLSRGVAEYFDMVESSAERATYETKRRGRPAPARTTFTMAEAQQAKLLDRGGKGDDNWSKYPAAMLRARAKSILAREVYPDVLMGVYSEDEAAELAPATGFQAPAPQTAPAPGPRFDAVDAEVIEPEQPTREGLAVAIASASSVAELEALVPKIRTLPKDDQRALQEPYQARRFDLREME